MHESKVCFYAQFERAFSFFWYETKITNYAKPIYLPAHTAARLLGPAICVNVNIVLS